MSWRPIYPEHAIERVRVIVTLAQPLSQKMVNRLREDADCLRAELDFAPIVEVMVEDLNYVPSPAGGQMQAFRKNTGWRLQKINDIYITEALTLINDSFSYEISTYSRWSDFKARLQSVATALLDTILPIADVSSLSLEYYDRFIFDGYPENADARQIISDQKIGSVVERERLSSRPFHIHVGWFEGIGDNMCLINQNIDAQDGKLNDQAGSVPGKDVRSIAILTKTDYRDPKEAMNAKSIFEMLDSLHSISKEVFCHALSDAAKKQLKLGL